MSYDDIWYKYRMEVMFNGEWREVGTSGDRNQARSILDNEYGGKRDFRIKEALSDKIVDYQDRTVTLEFVESVVNEFYRMTGRDRQREEQFRQEVQAEWYQDNNRFFRNLPMTTERPVQTSSQQEYRRRMDRYESRVDRIARFNFINQRPEPQAPIFVGVDPSYGDSGFTKVREPNEKVNWKEEGF